MTDGAPIGVGVVGLGMISRPHLEGYKAASGAELVAVCDVDPARAQAEGERYGATAYTDLTTLLADPRVDAVALLLPHQLHHASPARRSTPASTSSSRSPSPCTSTRRRS